MCVLFWQQSNGSERKVPAGCFWEPWWHWCSLSGRFLFICKCDDIFSFLYQERKRLGKLVVECILPREQQTGQIHLLKEGLQERGNWEREGQVGVWQWVILVGTDLEKMYLCASFFQPLSFPPKTAGTRLRKHDSLAESYGMVVSSWPERAASSSWFLGMGDTWPHPS